MNHESHMCPYSIWYVSECNGWWGGDKGKGERTEYERMSTGSGAVLQIGSSSVTAISKISDGLFASSAVARFLFTAKMKRRVRRCGSAKLNASNKIIPDRMNNKVQTKYM